jgi:hypothetical protein
VPISNQLTYLTVPEIQVRLFDKVSNLVIMALRKWTEHHILPEPGELAYFVKKIHPGKISNELLAFILCYAHIRREEIETGYEDKESFSINHFLCHLYGHSLLCGNHPKNSLSGLGDLGGSMYVGTPKNFIGGLLINTYKEGLHIYVVNIDELEIIYKPVSPDSLREAWEIFETCIRHLEKQRLTEFREAIGAV